MTGCHALDIERPAGEKTHGSYTVLEFTEEQQKRLNVDAQGNQLAVDDSNNSSDDNPPTPHEIAAQEKQRQAIEKESQEDEGKNISNM